MPAKQQPLFENGKTGKPGNTAGGAVRALTLHPIWAWAVVTGLKTVENRTWNTRYRGRLVIHAAANQPDEQGVRRWFAKHLGIDVPQDIPRGAIVGAVDLVDVVPITHELRGNPFASGPYCWMLANATRDETPTPMRGKQGLWRP